MRRTTEFLTDVPAAVLLLVATLVPLRAEKKRTARDEAGERRGEPITEPPQQQPHDAEEEANDVQRRLGAGEQQDEHPDGRQRRRPLRPDARDRRACQPHAHVCDA